MPAESSAPEWPEEIRLRVWIKHEHGGGYGAIVEEFCVAGMGDSPEAAHANAVDLTISYLDSFVEEGASFEDALRPISRRLRWKLEAERLIAKIVRMPNSWVQVRDSDADLHDLRSGLAAC